MSPLIMHPASLSAASFLFSRRSLSNAASAISRLGIFTVVSISFHFQLCRFLVFPAVFCCQDTERQIEYPVVKT